MRVISFIFTVLLYLYVAPVPVVTKGSPLQQRLFSALSKEEIHSALVEWMIRSLKSEERNGFQSYKHDLMMADSGAKHNGINQNMWPRSKLAANETPQSKLSSVKCIDGGIAIVKQQNGKNKKNKARPHPNARVG